MVFTEAVDLVVLAPCFEKQPVCTLCAVLAHQLFAFKAAALVSQYLSTLRIVIGAAVIIKSLVVASTEQRLLVLFNTAAACVVILAVRTVSAQNRLALVVASVAELLKLMALTASPGQLVLMIVKAVVAQLGTTLHVPA